MDTRAKIKAAADGGARAVVIGYFDPLVAGHARRLAELERGHGKLTVVLDTPPEPLLEARARAELVAALDAVEAVIVAGSASEALAGCGAAAVIDERAADLERRAEIMAQVRRRHGATAGVR